ncbi:MAG: [protein-PII] uridylyltransferase [Panacagrimonas sp.]
MSTEPAVMDDEGTELFSAKKLRARLRADTDDAVGQFRDTLAWGAQRLQGLFDDGQSAGSLVAARADLVDEVLKQVWSKYLGELSGLALIAVGGYGRGELLPYSDIDIMLLHDGSALETSRKPLEQMTAFLWDIGLEIGQSVRTVEDCVAESRRDITVMTTLLESRFLCGDQKLFEQSQRALGTDRLWPVADFFRAKKQEQQARHQKFDDTGYKLEPNVKEGPGGLRDIHTIAWVAKRHFGAHTLKGLREHGFLSKQECDELFAGQDFLWRVRFALHVITGRREDRLLFDHQLRVAALFGYVDTDNNRAVEQFMQLYYRTIKSLSCLNDMLLQLFEEAILHPHEEQAPRILNPRFQVRNGYIEARNEKLFQLQPQALLELFLLLQKHPDIEGVRAQTVRQILKDSRYLTQDVAQDIRSRRLFIEMFQHGSGLTRGLRRMNRYGVLGRYLPAFGKIVGLMQYDLFHTLTVDEHSLYVVRNLRRFAMDRFGDELPFCSQIMAQQERPLVLFVAGLYHDMAKGRGGDHSELGADEARQFCLDHGLSHADAELAAWLVRSHLLMSLTAQRADISDPEVVQEFVRKVKTKHRLDHLFLLTVADIRATNPALWNSWRASLLTDLYKAAKRALERGIENPMCEQEMVEEAQSKALGHLQPRPTQVDQARLIWDGFSSEYFVRHAPEELAWHLQAILGIEPSALPLILVRNIAGRGTTVFVYARDQEHLFALSTGVLARMGLNILDARINTTSDGFVLDSFVVIEADGSAADSSLRHEEIRQRLQQALGDPAAASVAVNRRLSSRLKHFDTPTSVYFSQDETRNRTILELITADQPGLLSIVGRVFQRRGILLDAAKIATIGERAEDVFFITNRDQSAISDVATLQGLREVLTRTLDRSARLQKNH